MSFNTCCVSNCLVRDRDDIPFHRFPRPEFEQERFQAWITNIGGETLTLDKMYVFKNRRVCQLHFEKKFHYPKNRLSKIAIPTLHLSGAVRVKSEPAKSISFVDVNEYQLPPPLSTCDRPSRPNSLLPENRSQPEKPPSPTPSSLPDTKQPDMFEVEFLDEEILQLDDTPILGTPMGSPIFNDIASKWHDALLYGLTKDVKENLMEDYKVPSNCDLLITPTLNPEVKAVLQDTVVKRDSELKNKQKQLSIAMSALATAAKLIISNETSKEKLLKPISDAGRILCNSHFMETETRRNLVVSSINTKLKDGLLETTSDRLLFGENLAEQWHAAKTMQQSGNAKMGNIWDTFDSRRIPRPAPKAQYGRATSCRPLPPPQGIEL